MGANASGLPLSESPSGSRAVATEQSGFDVMLSYAWADKQRVFKIRDKLRERGLRVWIDVDFMEGNIFSAMANAILNSTLFVACISSSYEKSKNAMREFHFAHNEDRQSVYVVLQDGHPLDASIRFLMGSALYLKCLGDNEGDYAAVADYIVKQIPQRYRSAAALNSRFQVSSEYDTAHELYDPLAQHLSRYNDALTGDPSAQNEIGDCYFYGTGVSKDYRRAVEWFQQAASQGDADGQKNLALCYEEGTGIEQNVNQAADLYRKSADQGNAYAQYHLGRCYYLGIGVEKDLVRAMSLCKESADHGVGSAQNYVGWFYQNGIGVEKDMDLAAKWFRKAAELGNAAGQYNLGCCYQNGLGVEEDMDQAAQWYRRSAEQGNAAAQSNLGWCYFNGFGVEKDSKEALHWYMKSAGQGEIGAQNFLEFFYDSEEFKES